MKNLPVHRPVSVTRVPFSYPARIFGLLVAEVLKRYSPMQRAAFRAGINEGMGNA